VTDWQLVWLAVIAVALMVMTVVQLAVLLALRRSANEVVETVRMIRQEVRPLADKINRLADDAGRAAALALAQVERLDRTLSVTTQRVDETLNVVQGALTEPIRQGAAVISALRGVLSVFRGGREARSGRDEEEALFVG
jgi:uncharacterized protein YoxC